MTAIALDNFLITGHTKPPHEPALHVAGCKFLLRMKATRAPTQREYDEFRPCACCLWRLYVYRHPTPSA